MCGTVSQSCLKSKSIECLHAPTPYMCTCLCTLDIPPFLCTYLLSRHFSCTCLSTFLFVYRYIYSIGVCSCIILKQKGLDIRSATVHQQLVIYPPKLQLNSLKVLRESRRNSHSAQWCPGAIGSSVVSFGLFSSSER